MTIQKTIDEQHIIKDISLSLDTERVGRFLKHGGRGNLKQQIASKIEEVKRLTVPKGMYLITKLNPFPQAEDDLPQPVRGADFIAFAVATIGGKLEKKTQQLMNAGKFTSSMILDALGSCAVSKLSHKVAEIIFEQAKSNRLSTTRVFEPGAGSSHWPIENQSFIFDNLDASQVGISLTPSYIMVPKKSISFIMGLGEKIQQAKDLFSCEGCPRTDCTYRYIPEGEK